MEMNSQQLNPIIGKMRYNEVSAILPDIAFPYAIVKGEVLSLYAYGDVGQRTSSDVDILVSRNHLEEMDQVLTQHGFSTTTRNRREAVMALAFSHQVKPYVTRRAFLSIDLDINFDIFWGEYTGPRVDMDDFISDAEPVEIYGVTVMTLPMDKTFVQLVLHHYKEMNSLYLLAEHNYIRRNLFQDLYFLVKRNPKTCSPAAVKEQCEKCGARPYAFYMVYYSSLVFPDAMWQPYIEILRSEEGEALLDWYGLSEQERKRWRVDFSARLDAPSVLEYIQQDLTKQDLEKIRRNREVFG